MGLGWGKERNKTHIMHTWRSHTTKGHNENNYDECNARGKNEMKSTINSKSFACCLSRICHGDQILVCPDSRRDLKKQKPKHPAPSTTRGGGRRAQVMKKKRCQNHRRDKLTMWIAGRLSNPRWVALGEKRFLLCKRLFSTLGGYYLFRHLYISVIASGLKTEWLLAKILFSVSSFWFSLFGFH